MGGAQRNPSIDEPQPGDAALIAALRAKLEETIRLGNEQGADVGSWAYPVAVREARALFAAVASAREAAERERDEARAPVARLRANLAPVAAGPRCRCGHTPQEHWEPIVEPTNCAHGDCGCPQYVMAATPTSAPAGEVDP